MIELLKLLEKIGITIAEDAAPELIAAEKQNLLDFINQALLDLNAKVKTLKIAQHMATFGHGLLVDDAKIAVEEGVIAGLNAAKALLEKE